MRDDGPNVAAAGANIGAIAMKKAMQPQLDKKSAENIVAVPIVVNGYKDGKENPKPIYMEKGLSVSFGNGETYTIGDDGKIYDKNNKVVSNIKMSADEYGALGGMSQTAGEKTDKNADFYVLTAQDIREAQDKIHPFVAEFGKRMNNPDGQQSIQRRVNDTERRLGTESHVRLDLEKGHGNDIDVAFDEKEKVTKFTVKLSDATDTANRGKRTGSVSIFMK